MKTRDRLDTVIIQTLQKYKENDISLDTTMDRLHEITRRRNLTYMAEFFKNQKTLQNN